MSIADFFCFFCLYIVQPQLYIQSSHKYSLQIYHSTSNVTRCIEKSTDRKAETLICGFFHKCNLELCMQSHPIKPILSSMSCGMQSVFRHHIYWVSHMSVKHEKMSPLVFTPPLPISLQPCILLLAQEQQVAIASELLLALLRNLQTSIPAQNQPSCSQVSSFVFATEQYKTLQLA